MKFEEVTFDNFLLLDVETQNIILNDFDKLKYLIKNNVNEHRYLHSINVAQTCAILAKYHNIDERQAYISGLLHDCCKFYGNDSNDKLTTMVKKYCPEKLDGIIGAYHSYVAPYYLKEKLNFKDERALKAIYNHTILNDNDELSMILYIADKREPSRGINDDILDVAKNDLVKACKLLQIDIEKYLKSKNEGFVKSSI